MTTLTVVRRRAGETRVLGANIGDLRDYLLRRASDQQVDRANPLISHPGREIIYVDDDRPPEEAWWFVPRLIHSGGLGPRQIEILLAMRADSSPVQAGGPGAGRGIPSAVNQLENDGLVKKQRRPGFRRGDGTRWVVLTRTGAVLADGIRRFINHLNDSGTEWPPSLATAYRLGSTRGAARLPPPSR